MPPDLGSLRASSIAELVQTARALNIENASGLKKPDLVAAILRASNAGQQVTDAEGVLEILPDGFGFLRAAEYSFLPGPDDVYVSPSQIRRFNLRTGDTLTGSVRAPKENERYFALIKVGSINGADPEAAREKVLFENLTAVHPRRWLRLESAPTSRTARLIDLVAPLGVGQRALVCGPARSGKTEILRAVAEGVVANHPEVKVILVLVAERPEDVTDLSRALPVEVLATTFDEPDARHVQVAEMAVERAKRLVEHKQDVVVLFDSLNRLARAANSVVSPTGRLIGGSIDVAALQRARRVLGAARAVEEGGSLTVVATVQNDPASRVDDALYDELRGPENLTLVTRRDAADRGVFPALDLARSFTHRTEHFLDAAALAGRAAWKERVEGDLDLALAELARVPTNAALLDSRPAAGELRRSRTA